MDASATNAVSGAAKPRSHAKHQRAVAGASEPGRGEAPLEQVARQVLGRYLEKLRENEPAARGGDDPEAVHDMRTSLRRLRTMLQVLEESPAFDAEELFRLRRGLRRLARRLGEVRDLDVLLAHAQDHGQTHPDRQDDLAPLRSEIQRWRGRAHEDLLDELDRPTTRRLIRRLDRLVARSPKRSAEERTVLVRHFAGGALWRRYEAVLSYEQALAEASPATLHQLRIACKRLRYTLELFEGALGPGTEPLLKTLVATQDHLGAIQDHIAAQARLAATSRDHPDNTALTAYAAARATDRARLQASIGPLWEQLSSASFRADLAGLIAAL